MGRFILSLILTSGLFTYYYGGGAGEGNIRLMVQASAQEYLEDFGAPVNSNKVIAFLRSEGEGEAHDLALFLTEDSVMYYNPHPERVLSTPSFTLSTDQISNVRYLGTLIYINGKDGSQIQMKISNAMYARYFKDRLKEITGAGEA